MDTDGYIHNVYLTEKYRPVIDTETLIGANISKYLSADDCNRLMTAMRAAIETTSTSFVTYEIRTRNGNGRRAAEIQKLDAWFVLITHYPI